MTTIRMADPATVTGKTKELFDAVLRREAAVFGATSVSNIWRCMAHWPALLEANWNRSRTLMLRPMASGHPSGFRVLARTEGDLTR